MVDSGAQFPLFYCAFAQCHRTQDTMHGEMSLERHVKDEHLCGKALANYEEWKPLLHKMANTLGYSPPAPL